MTTSQVLVEDFRYESFDLLEYEGDMNGKDFT